MNTETMDSVARFGNILELIETAFDQYAEKPAYTCMGCTITYDRLNHLSDLFASFIRNTLQLKPGDRLAVQLPNTLQFVVVFYGAIKAGVIIVNANPLFRPREIEHQLIDSGAKALVVLANVAHNAAQIIDNTLVEHVIVTQIADLHPSPKRQFIHLASKFIKPGIKSFNFKQQILFRDIFKKPYVEYEKETPLPDDILVLQYTGGTTGVAKGAMLTHQNLTTNVWQLQRHIPHAFERNLQNYVACLPLYHIYALNLHALSVFSCGGHNILIPNPRDMAFTVKELKKHEFHVFVGINTLFNALEHYAPFRTLNFSNLKVTCAGGMTLTQETARLWKSITGCTIQEGYGLTETSPVVCGNQIDNYMPGSVGTVVPETVVKLIDADGNTVTNKGELCIKGPQVMKGYWQNDKETLQAFTEDGWFKTGDIAEILDSGHVKIVDRKKDLILVSGFNVYPAEIEEVVCQMPEVSDAAAIGVKDERCGEVVKLIVVPKSSALTKDMVKKHCRAQLTGYKIPKYIAFRESLPKSNIGKVLRRELRDET